MPIKDILVHVDDTLHAGARLDAAITIAGAHQAHLIGLCVSNLPQIPPYVRIEIPDDIRRRQAQVVEAAAQRSQAMFEKRVRRAGVIGEWRRASGPVEAQVALHGRYTDVVVVGQRDPTGNDGAVDPAMPDELILTIGRPVLVVPYVGAFPRIGERIMVAWDASRTATRAVNDALPLMAGARAVVVMTVNPRSGPQGGDGGHGEIPSADICLHLARHGVNAEAQHLYADDIEVGAMLLSRAADEGIDLMVAGAYGHARWRELVLGGVTRHLLRHMTLPVLMSH